MKKRWQVWVVILICGVGIYFFYDRATDSKADTYYDLENWPPNAAAIRSALQAEKDDEARRTQFAKLFQSRFRSHTPMMAIGLRFTDATHIKLMVPAREEPWNIDRVALSAWQEARVAFKREFDLDIFETYIGSPPIHIGRLRALPEQPEKASITYLAPRTRRKLRGSAITQNTETPPRVESPKSADDKP